MKKLVTLFIMITMFSFVANTQNYTVNLTNDTIDVNTTWAYDTVFMDASLCISDDVVLTINPGSVIMFNDFYKINVEGTLLSQGTETDTIIYTVADTTGYYNLSHTGWDGIDFNNNDGSMDDNDTTRFKYCAFYYGRESNDRYGGGALRIQYYSKIKIENSLFRYNYSDDNAGTGGAIGIQYDAEPIISNCTFLDNNASDGGGAISIGCYDDETKFDQAIIKNCYFRNNRSYGNDSYYGGGAIKISGYSDAYVYNNVFENNSSLSQGGALITSGYCQPYIANNLFVNNTSGHNGGAIGIKYYAGGFFINNTIVNNYSGNNGGAVSIGCDNDSVFFANNIIGGNSDLDDDYNQFYIDSEDESMKFYNNDIEGGLDGTYSQIIYVDNIDEDPLFIDEADGNFKLQSSSPCIDAGKDTTDYIPESDLAGMSRIYGNGIDMGAFEYQPGANIEEVSDKNIFVYPNPATEYFYVILNNVNNYSVRILDINGKVIYCKKSINNKLKINTETFAKGVYFISINSDKINQTQKLIIQ